ncbi:esterase-like activity of phytase family protein [Microbulbifer echini]|uniref:Esterase-like activity of phytase family protein n=1 Tax=Microbulbifer echini TaxID=1529067 RepID=A0ABV4NQ99_9GAMM
MIKRFLLSVASILLAPLAVAAEIIPAKLQASYWVDNSEGLDISGLSFCDGKLLAVSDKNSGEIYWLVLDGKRAELRTHRLLTDLETPSKEQGGSLWVAFMEIFRPADQLDFEGISCTGDAIHLVSEHYNRIANVDGQGRASWQEHIWSPIAKAEGYLQKPNASSEGLVRAAGAFWVAMEREPRGLLQLNSKGEVSVFSLPSVAGLGFYGRSEDLAGLDYYDGALFTLERNAHAVCRRELPSLEAQWCVDYRALEESPERIYEETRYGKGEGLAVNPQGIFVVLDNNNVGRAQVPQDKRALLLHLTFPDVHH